MESSAAPFPPARCPVLRTPQERPSTPKTIRMIIDYSNARYRQSLLIFVWTFSGRRDSKLSMLNTLSTSPGAAVLPHNTFLLVQEIVDEVNYNRLTENVQSLHTLCVGDTDKVRLIFSDDTPGSLSQKIFQGLDQHSKATLLLLSTSALCPGSCVAPPPSMTAHT